MLARSRHRAYVAAALACASPFLTRSQALAGDPASDTRTPPPVSAGAALHVYSGNHTYTVAGVDFSAEGQYVFLRVTQIPDHGPQDRAWTAPVWFEAAAIPTQPSLVVHIDSIVPNPVGDDTQLEQASIHNIGTVAVSMVGWKLRDKSGSAWSFDALGTLAPNGAFTIVRHGQPMSMNNSGDEVIELVSPTAGVVDEIHYSGAADGQVINHAAP